MLFKERGYVSAIVMEYGNPLLKLFDKKGIIINMLPFLQEQYFLSNFIIKSRLSSVIMGRPKSSRDRW